jgi:hypothetical protein
MQAQTAVEYELVGITPDDGSNWQLQSHHSPFCSTLRRLLSSKRGIAACMDFTKMINSRAQLNTAAMAHQMEERTFEDFSLPSDEWGETDKSLKYDEETYEEVQEKKTTVDDSSLLSKPDHKSYLSNSSFADYLSHIFPGKFSNGCTSAADTKTETRPCEASKGQPRTDRSSHSRCYIENTESIRDCREDRPKRESERDNDVRDDAGNSDAAFSVEEFTQISEITMDIPTVMAETKFVACSGLPTIEEAKRFDPTIAACAAGFSRRNVRAHCGAGDSNGNTPNSSSKDVIDFVFELVEETFCVPLNRTKAEKKRDFMEAYHEETAKFARTNSMIDPWQTASKHSRSNRTPKRSGKAPSLTAPSNGKFDTRDRAEMSLTPAQSCHKRQDNPSKVVDASPCVSQVDPQSSMAMDEEQTLDWSKIMSFAEKQLESDEKSVVSKVELSKMRTNRNICSFKQGLESSQSPLTLDNCSPQPAAEQDRSTASSLSNSSSTHATAADSTNITENVQEMRDFSAMDSSSFEEEPRRLLFTSLLFSLIIQLIPGAGGVFKQSSMANQRSGVLHCPTAPFPESGDGNSFHNLFQITSFFLIFMAWPAGIPRQKMEYKPIPGKPKKPSLLKLVFEADKPDMC